MIDLRVLNKIKIIDVHWESPYNPALFNTKNGFIHVYLYEPASYAIKYSKKYDCYVLLKHVPAKISSNNKWYHWWSLHDQDIILRYHMSSKHEETHYGIVGCSKNVHEKTGPTDKDIISCMMKFEML